MLYINSQRDFLSTGPAGGGNSAYLRNSAIPEMGLQYIYESYNRRCSGYKTLFGLGIDYKYIIPRIVTDSNVYTRNGVHGLTAIAFIHRQGRLTANTSWGIKAKALYGQNCNEYLLLGGYAYQHYDDQPLNPKIDYKYTPIQTVAAWIDLYTKIKEQWEIGLFGGYSKNLGSLQSIQSHNNPSAYFVRGRDIDYLYRASVRVKYTVQKIQFGFEPEYTVAAYSNTLNEKGVPQKKSATFPDAKMNVVGNLRLLFNATLYF